jgi:hypothetical protein
MNLADDNVLKSLDETAAEYGFSLAAEVPVAAH